MRVFVTGATGFIGTAVVRELIESGHRVSALARSANSAKTLKAMGVEPRMGAIDDLACLRDAAAAADGAIHLAFMHGPAQVPLLQRLGIIFGGLPSGIVTRFLRVAVEADRQAIETLGAALKNSDRPLVTTFGTMGLAHASGRADRPVTEADGPASDSPGYGRAKTEGVVAGLASQGIRAMIIRLAPSVHGDGDTGLVPRLISIARTKGASGYVGAGDNRWSAVHRSDAARLFRLALENGVAGARYHGVGEEAISTRAIADVIGRKLNVPTVSVSRTEAARRFGFLAPFFMADNPASSSATQASLGWAPKGPGLIDDLENGRYFSPRERTS